MTISQDCGKVTVGQQTGSVSGEDPFDTESTVYEQVAGTLNISRTKIEDVYRCTPLQEALITLSSAGSGAYVKRIVLSLNPDTDLEKFRSAIEDVAKSTAILRTRIVQCSPLGFVQVVLLEAVQWSEEDSLEKYLERSNAEKWGVNDPLLRYTLVRDDQGLTRWFVWSIHHALYDGWSFPLMVAKVSRRYTDNLVEPTPQYKDFVTHIKRKNLDGNNDYWLSTLAGTHYTQFPMLSKVSYMPVADTTLQQYCPPLPKVKGITRTALLRGAWAVVLNRFNDSEDVVFGTIVSGRKEPIAGIQDLIGPTVATVPVRVRVGDAETTDKYLQMLQEQTRAMSSFDQLGLHAISEVSSDARQACSFQTLLVVQPGNDTHTIANDLGVWKRLETDVGRSSYALTTQCFLNKTGIRIVAAFDSSVIDTWKVQKMLDQFIFVAQQLAESYPSQSMAELEAMMSPQDLQSIWEWNATVPPAVEACVHDLISQTARTQPDAPAICAWDGNLNFEQVDRLSTRLAHHLVNLGVTANVLVPLLFEKSVWTPIAMLGVMKAGGVSIALDTTQPEDRLKSIVDQTAVRLMLSSQANEVMARRIGKCDVAVVGGEHLAILEKLPSSALNSPLPNIRSDHKLMILFTSGSTGTPKGTIISHTSFSTAIKHHGPVFGIAPGERIYDFASYSFDIAWFNVLQALSHGACLCVPSEAERKNDLEESLIRFKATLVFLTPSVARLLDAGRLSHIRCVALGGEPQKWSDFQAWPTRVKKLSVYGPAECTVVSAATDASILKRGDMLIGRGLASANWILTTTDSPTLAPIGTVGELWIEGPLVGQGYLNQPVGKPSPFVENPSWLKEGADGHLGRCGRLYKTGDLVRYNFDGTLAFVGRKDTQVKIRGQRVELSEVEYHIRRILNNANSDLFDGIVIAEVIMPQGSKNPILVVFICLGMTYTGREGYQSEEECAAVVHDLVDGLDERLTEVVPSYMIPNAFIPMLRIPMTHNGKTDRRRLRDIGRMTYRNHILRNAQHERLLPSNDIEKNLLEVWVEVLNSNPDAISTNMSFTRIGGDSITAMQVVSRLRARNLVITVGEMLRAQTIQKIAMLCTSTIPVPSLPEEEAESFSWTLSPIQQMFFDSHPRGLNHFNQGFLLKLRYSVSNDSVKTALKAVVGRHSMLRARFRINEKSEWEQFISSNDSNAFAFSERSVQVTAEIRDIIQARQTTLDISDGPVFAADLFTDAGGAQFLFLVAHHLVIDLVSWRILWFDIESTIRARKTTSSHILPFRKWCGLQRVEGQSLALAEVLPFSVAKPNWEYWGVTPAENTHEGSKQYNRHLDMDTSNVLLGKSNDVFRTEVTDILVATLIYTFRETFSDRQPPAVFLEGHGREPLNNIEVDLSETVGWFTMLYPLQVSAESTQTIFDWIKLAKDTRRSIAGKGRPYFSYRYHSASGRQDLKDHSIPELVLNFTGAYQQLENVNGLFQFEDYSNGSGRSLSMSPGAIRFGLIEVVVGVNKGRISISFGVHQKMRLQPQLEKWTDQFTQQLKLIVHRLAGMPASFTPSDFPLLARSFKGLDTLLEKTMGNAGITVDMVKDIYPCTPLQEGILMSINKEKASYANYFIWECMSAGNKLISPDMLERAWRSVVAHHSILSTVFAEQLDMGSFIQILLRDHAPKIAHTRSYSKSAVDVLREQNRPLVRFGDPEHTFTICQASNGDVACRLDISHVLIDAASISVLVDDITRACQGQILSTTAPFSQYIQHLISVPKSSNVTFWTQCLANVQRCHFPIREALDQSQVQSRWGHDRIMLPASATSGIHSFCQDRGITRSVFVQIAWALVLSQYTGLRKVCFGYMVSGRDAPIRHVENMVGPLINILISHIDLDQTIERVFSTTFRQSVEQLDFQHTSLAEIQHQLGLGPQPLFNTAITVRESRHIKSPREDDICFREIESSDPDEFDITLATEIDGPVMQISVSYQQTSVTGAVAQEVVFTLRKVIEHLLCISLRNTTSGKAEPHVINRDKRSLYDDFFTSLTGIREDMGIEYWRQEFEGFESPQFPPLPSLSYSPCADDLVYHEIQGLKWLNSNFTETTFIRAAWAILEVRYTNSSETTFGALIAKRQAAPEQDPPLNSELKPATVPVRVMVSWDGQVRDLLMRIQKQAVDMAHFEKMGQQRIQRINQELKKAYQFQTLLVVEPTEMKDSGAALAVGHNLYVQGKNGENGSEPNQMAKFDGYALTLQFRPQKGGMQILINFDPTVIVKAQVDRITFQFEHVLRQILAIDDRTVEIQDINAISTQDLYDIWQRNAVVPTAAEGCVHDSITSAARRKPDAPAVCAWDDELTYQQLDEISNNVAYELIRQGVKLNMTVALCFEKSAWTSVAMLGVMKAGGVSVNMDITQPEDRLRTIIRQATPHLILSSISKESLASKLSQCQVMILGKQVSYLTSPYIQLPLVGPEHRLYIVFTSGTTGTPKGVITTHGNFCSAMKHQQTLGFTSASRVYDFASYAFDASWSNALHTLAAGGCLCVPTDEERKHDLTKSIQTMKANYVDLTPTVAQFLTPNDVPLLETLILGGERLISKTFDHWPERIRIVNTYGPAECTIVSTSTDVHRGGQDRGIGTGIGTVTWVVDVSGKYLAAVGTIGELWIEGPLVGEGYFNDPVRTNAAFFEDPLWLLQGITGQSGRHGRLYKTGDLVRYNLDGSLSFVERKDMQVKINGQRVELGEVEHHIRKSLSVCFATFDGIVVAEMITSQGSDHAKLVSFIYRSEIESNAKALHVIIMRLNELLAEVVPPHMIPSAFVEVQRIPMTATGKIDRRRLREIYASVAWEQIAAFGSSSSKRYPQTLQEQQLQSLWAGVLNLDPHSIGADDNFLRIGGDSVRAMKLIGAAREQGLSIKMADIFNHPRLGELAQLLNRETNDIEQAIPSFSLMKVGAEKESAARRVASLCDVSSDEIEDIFSCTSLQEGLLAMTARQSGDYISQFVYELPSNIDIARFVEAWTRITKFTSILRTRIVDLSGGTGLVQVILKSQTSWSSGDDLKAYLQRDKQVPMGLGTPLARHGLVTNQVGGMSKTYFIWTIHHALYDGWSLPLFLEVVDRAYFGEQLPALKPFQLFIKHVDSTDRQAGAHFWREQFEGLDACQFPLLPSPAHYSRVNGVLAHDIHGVEWYGSDFTATTMIRTAWAILAARYTDAKDAVFGAVSTGRQAAVQGIEHVMGPTFVTVPVRIAIDWAGYLQDLLQKTQQQAMQMVEFEQMGLQSIKNISADAERGCQFQTLLVVQPEKIDSDKATIFRQQSDLNDEIIAAAASNFSTYALMLDCYLKEQGMQLRISFDSAVIDRLQVMRIARQFEYLLRQVRSEGNRAVPIRDLEIASEQDIRDIWEWNKIVPPAVESTVHGMIAETVLQQPSTQAICAWDGDLTYEKLDRLSTELAHRLLKLGVNSDMIPLFFEKSMWMPVAVLGTMKASGVFIALDTTQPEENLQRIISQVAPKLVISSPVNEALAKRLCVGCMVVTLHDGLLDGPGAHISDLPEVGPDNRLYVVFTSGTTGEPKGAMITHRNFCSAMKYHTGPLGFTSRSRVFDFASYAFDVAWSNLLHTLYAGGCLCIPSDSSRKQDLAGSIRSFKATLIELTPSTAQILSHRDIPDVTDVILGGETLTEAAFAHWPKHVRLTNTYGPAECTINSTFCEIDRNGEQDRRGIGTAIGSVTWIVSNDGRDLAAIGTIGELWLEGPIIGQGYFNNVARTTEAFIENPAWLLRGGGGADYPGRHACLYKTGDLVRYNMDGSITFIGRKDTQVKIHGQRVELSAVEHHFLRLINSTFIGRQYGPDTAPKFDGLVVAEVITPQNSDRPALVIFIYPGESYTKSAEECAKAVHNIMAVCEEKLVEVMPSHMMPNAILPLETVPKLSSQKVDRRRLRALGSSLTMERMAALSSFSKERRAPRTQSERILQSLWARVLNLEANSISIDDNFTRIGGDSIKAMQLAAMARNDGLSLLVADILRHPRLIRLAEFLEGSNFTKEKIRPFSLLGADANETSVRKDVAILCQTRQIQDVFPCTPFQEGLLALSARRQGDYVARFIEKLRSDIDIARFTKAWDEALLRTPILRTRFVNLPGRGVVQAVIKHQSTWLTGHDVSRYLQEDKVRTMELGEALSRTALVKDHRSGDVFFIWTVHHALYDGWSLSLLFDMVQRIYEGNSPRRPLAPFQAFIQYLIDMDCGLAEVFWKEQFKGLETSPFPALPSPTYHPNPDKSLIHNIDLLPWSSSSFTASTIIRLTWTILFAKRSGTSEAVFGTIVSGRDAAVPCIEQVLAPTIATVPVRIKLNWDHSIAELLENVQKQTADMIPFEQMGLQRIRRLNENAKQACQFQTLLVVQPKRPNVGESYLFVQSEDVAHAEPNSAMNFSTYALTLECQLREEGMQLLVKFDSSVIEKSQVSRLVQQFDHLLRQVSAAGSQSTQARDISMLDPRDAVDIWQWNKVVPAPAEACIHDLIEKNSQANAPAVDAWNGRLTYGRLDELSTYLAQDLVKLGVGPEVMVPLCFEKSMWMTVAMLGVLKAGGVLVPVDVSQAIDRARLILNDVQPVVVVTSRKYKDFAHRQGYRTIQPEDTSIHGQRKRSTFIKANVTPRSAAYIIHTSGSTGKPKGVIIEHGAASTSLLAHGAELGLSQTSRFLQFASHSFDACIMEILTTLVYQGCVCVPSDEDRLRQLTESINEMAINTIFVTPSVARLLQPDQLPNLDTLALGGELVPSSETHRWMHLPRLVDAYGPAECAIVSVMQVLTGRHVPPQTIGKAVGSVAWVVDPENHENLLPVGAIGELLLEGNILARGYLNNSALTKAAFIDDPTWLLHGAPGQPGQPGRHGRLYKTGDLVRYNEDGTLVYIGRKDTQVKIHGQRVELGEVEFQIRRLIRSTWGERQDVVDDNDPTSRVFLAAEVITPKGSSQRTLVVFIVPGKAYLRPGDDCAAVVQDMVAGLDRKLANVLPPHMIPSAYIPLESMPMTTTDKTDRRQLRDIGHSLTRLELASTKPQGTVQKRLPVTDAERTLQQVWARILNLTNEIGLDDDFFTLGGDSISAMLVSVAARSHGLHVPVNHIMVHHTIAKLASALGAPKLGGGNVSATTIEEDQRRFNLSPIQQFHFDTRSDGPDLADLPFYLRLAKYISPDVVKNALHALVKRHPMLRARFCRDVSGKWAQYISKNVRESLLFRQFGKSSESEKAAIIAECRGSINIEHGPLFVASLFEDHDGQTLFLSTHHLVIDFVSWRVLFQDMEDFVTAGTFMSSPSTTFQKWCSLQEDYASKYLEPEAALNHQLIYPPLDYWGLEEDEPGKEVYIRKQFLLDESTSAAILGPCSGRLRVRPHELMMAALFYSYGQVFQDRTIPPIFTEGHGRGAWDDSIDLSQTVGWLTTMFPIQMAAKQGDTILTFIDQTRESLRAIPRQGWSYFACKYLNERGRKAFLNDPIEINFNFLGRFQQLERDDDSSLLEALPLPPDCKPPAMAPLETIGVFDITIIIERGRVQADFKYSARVRHQDRVEGWIRRYEQALLELTKRFSLGQGEGEGEGEDSTKETNAGDGDDVHDLN